MIHARLAFIIDCLCAVTCVIIQKNGAGIHTAHSCYWDVGLVQFSSLFLAHAFIHRNDNCARVAYPLANKREVQDSRMYAICQVPST